MPVTQPREYALYLRKSQGRAGIKRQRTVTTAHIEALGAVIAAEFSDADRTAYRHVGAARPEREDFDRMIEWLGSHPGAGVAAYHADRLMRDPEDTEHLIRVCAAGGHLVETRDGGTYDLSTATGRKRLRDDATDATYEVDRNTERIVAQKTEAAQAGEWLGSMRPFGYQGIPAEPGSERKFDGLTTVPAEAAAISAAARDVLAGTSLHSIVRDWNAKGLRGTQGGTWTVSNLRRLLVNPRYAGIATHRGKETGPAKWDLIIPVEVFRALQVKIGARTNPGRPGGRRWLGSGLYLCGVCDKPVHVHGGLNDRHKERSYSCPGHVARQTRKLDLYVTEFVLSYLERPESAKALAEASPQPRGEDVSLLQAQKILIEDRRRKLGEHYARDVIGDEELAAGTTQARADLAALDRRIAAASRIDPLSGLAGDLRIRERWPDFDLIRRQAIIRELITVKIHPAGSGRPKGVPWPQSWFDESLIEIIPVRQEGNAQ